MAVDHHSDHMVTAPGEVVGATDPGQSETRKNHDSTLGETLARVSRRRLIIGAAGAVGLVLAGGGSIYAATRGDSVAIAPAEPTDPTEGQRGPETGPAFEKDIVYKNMKLPETLDAPTFDGVVQNLGLAIQYAVNNNDTELIRRLIPGGDIHDLQPGQFEYRAEWLKACRESVIPGIGGYNQPDSPQFYAWGFKMELVKMVNHQKDKPTDEDVNNFVARVRITMGELQPIKGMELFPSNIEEPHTFETEAAFSRVGKLKPGGAYDYLEDLDGKGRGWGLSNTDTMYSVSPFLAQNPPKGYTEVPDLYKKSAF